MSTTGHESEAINVQGLKASLQELKDDYITDVAYLSENDGSAVVADFDPQTDTVWKKAQTLSAAEKQQVQQNIGVREWLNNLTGEKFVSVTATDQTTSVASLLPATGATDTIYRVGKWDGTEYNQEYYSDYAWDGTAYVQLNKKSIVGEVFDISEFHAGATYANLTAALGTNGANIPESVRKGGMSVKYVSNSDNKYVQFRLMENQWSTTPSDWQGVDVQPIPGSKNYVESGGVAEYVKENSATIEDSTHEFAIKDDDGNVLLLSEGGHLKTKNFNSQNVTQTTDEEYVDCSINDNAGNSIAVFVNGHIKTKNFNSEKLNPSCFSINKFANKRIAIIGDSISTFNGAIPSGYATYYPHGDVQTVEQTWWYQVANNLEMFYTNTSWSGSSVTGEPKGDTAFAACSDKRVNDAGRDGNPDIIIFCISCNDWGWNRSLGNWQVSDPITDDSEFTPTDAINYFREAYALMIYKFANKYPSASLFCCTNMDELNRDYTTGWPSNNGGGISTYQWNQNIKEVAEALGAKVIDLHACGINYMNIAQYSVDSPGLHPNAAGHKIMADFITAQLISKY